MIHVHLTDLKLWKKGKNAVILVERRFMYAFNLILINYFKMNWICDEIFSSFRLSNIKQTRHEFMTTSLILLNYVFCLFKSHRLSVYPIYYGLLPFSIPTFINFRFVVWSTEIHTTTIRIWLELWWVATRIHDVTSIAQFQVRFTYNNLFFKQFTTNNWWLSIQCYLKLNEKLTDTYGYETSNWRCLRFMRVVTMSK